MDHVCRITRSYAELVRVFSNWTEVSDQVLVYEHPPGISRHTGKMQKEHCHVLIQGCKIGEEGIKKRIKSIIRLHGNGDWCWSKSKYEGREKYITYMSKGKYQPKYNKGYETSELEQLRGKWIEPILPAIDQPILVKQPDKETVIGIWAEYVVHFEKWFNGNKHLEMKQFQQQARKFWYNQSEHHLFPPGSQQKRFLTSIYYHYKVINAGNHVYDETELDTMEFNALT